jgi:hypothetical protein
MFQPDSITFVRGLTVRVQALYGRKQIQVQVKALAEGPREAGVSLYLNLFSPRAALDRSGTPCGQRPWSP